MAKGGTMKPSTSYRSCSYNVQRLTSLAAVSPARQASKAVLKRVRRQELNRLQVGNDLCCLMRFHCLQALLPPSMQQVRRRQQREASIVANAARYIDALHATILARVANGTLSTGESVFPVLGRTTP